MVVKKEVANGLIAGPQWRTGSIMKDAVSMRRKVSQLCPQMIPKYLDSFSKSYKKRPTLR